MKIRNGFVSNSSSSSFMLMYDKTVQPNEVNLNDGEYSVIGNHLADGEDYFEISSEDMLVELQSVAHLNGNYFVIYKNPKVVAVGDFVYDNAILVTQEMVGKYIVAFEKDYHCTSSPEEFSRRYNR